ncbi:hypothetical protein BT96DRAFT_939212 [Gymnopus androsaceus JB14]|uniref:Uncharacterized protein n=1 Tax=Gymnopus androsaceus JB14 TaxID=1447944 RepID=A0A6A4HL73_9AGAR|nr:hypothetical protein BT96DRAFT_939212 [Gymnopus androsaceus JB14]
MWNITLHAANESPKALFSSVPSTIVLLRSGQDIVTRRLLSGETSQNEDPETGSTTPTFQKQKIGYEAWGMHSDGAVSLGCSSLKFKDEIKASMISYKGVPHTKIGLNIPPGFPFNPFYKAFSNLGVHYHSGSNFNQQFDAVSRICRTENDLTLHPAAGPMANPITTGRN